MEKMFDIILDKDEKIIKVYKPNKLKLYISSLLAYILMFGWFFAFGAVGLFATESPLPLAASLSILIGSFVLITLIAVIIIRIYYKNLYYAYSNKRVIIRTGVFGIDFKSLDIKMIGATNVYVSLLDKILAKNTGTISFGSMASPMVSYGNSNAMGYKFAHITLPYETYKEIKNIIDEKKGS